MEIKLFEVIKKTVVASKQATVNVIQFFAPIFVEVDLQCYAMQVT